MENTIILAKYSVWKSEGFFKLIVKFIMAFA